MGIDKFNHEGYSDPTTYEALTNIHREEVAADKKAAYLPLVYVCSPYAGDIENNVKNAKAYIRNRARIVFLRIVCYNKLSYLC